MNKLLYIPAAIAMSSFSAVAQQSTTDIPVDTKLEETELSKLTAENSLKAEKLKAELAEARAEIAKLKLQRELLSEKQQIEELKQSAIKQEKVRAAVAIEEQLEREASILKETTLQEAELEAIKIKSTRDNFADNKPVYLENPLQEDNILVISDRRIAFNGPVTSHSADHICDRIHYYNNKDKKLPIFIVINDSPGGSVMAGYRILKAMEGSDAPVYVVVKSFAASMAATIATLAEESYAYPNAIILHHQLSSSFFFRSMNLTQQKESYEDAKRWWDKLATPVANKMGISTDEFIKQMYEHNSDGDWLEFATEAKKLKWVNHIVSGVKETGAIVNPDTIKPKEKLKEGFLTDTIGSDGKPCMYLPRLNPHDAYFLYNPDGYYRKK